MDSYSMQGAAVREVIEWDPMVSIAGALPGNFRNFLRAIGNPANKVGDIAKKVGHTLREHGKQIYTEYNKLVVDTERRKNTSSIQNSSLSSPPLEDDDNPLWGDNTLTNYCYFDQLRQDFDQI